MKQSINIAVILSIAFATGIICSLALPSQQPIPDQQVDPTADHSSQVVSADYEAGRDAGGIQLCQFAYGEWIGPHRTPHVDEYRLRVGDDLEFVYVRTREKSLHPYQMYVGDTIEVSSAIDESLNQVDLIIRSDGKTTFAVKSDQETPLWVTLSTVLMHAKAKVVRLVQQR